MMILWASTHIGGTYGSGEFVSESWEDAGFTVDSDGNPTHDPRGNTIAKYTSQEFDPDTDLHVDLICDYATESGGNNADIREYLSNEFDLTDDQIESRLGEWFANNENSTDDEEDHRIDHDQNRTS